MKAERNGSVSKETQELIAKFFAKHGRTRENKKVVGHMFSQGVPEPMYGSLSHCTRVCYDDEVCTEYGILDPNDFEGGLDEVVDILEHEKVFNTSPYDCTGRFYTAYQLVHVNPTGLVSFVHHMVLDV